MALFATLDAIVHTRILKTEENESLSETVGQEKARYLNFWQIDLKRMDLS